MELRKTKDYLTDLEQVLVKARILAKDIEIFAKVHTWDELSNICDLRELQTLSCFAEALNCQIIKHIELLRYHKNAIERL